MTQRSARKILVRALIAATALAVAACATTEYTSTWKDENVQRLGFAGHKIAAMVIGQQASMRHAAEEALAREMSAHGVEGIPAYALISETDRQDEQKVAAKLEAAGVIGVVAMRPAGRDVQVTVSPGMPTYPVAYRGFRTYYAYGMRPATVDVDTTYFVETMIYDLRTDRLVWSGTSKSSDPKQLPGFMQELVVATVKQLRQDGLIPEAK